MTLFRFEKNDVFYNQIKTHPKINFKYNNQIILLNNSTSSANLDLYDSIKSSNHYPFLTKQGSLYSLRSISVSDFNSNFLFGDTITGSYPLTSSISSDHFSGSVNTRYCLRALKNTLNHYSANSNHYSFSSSLGNKDEQELRLISIPEIYYGSSINKGTVSMKFYITGTLAGELRDDKRNGELRQYLPNDANSGSVAGIVLYNEGFMILTGSWNITTSHSEQYKISPLSSSTNPTWIDFFSTGSTTGSSDLTNIASSSFELDFEGTQYIPTITMFAHAKKSELNFSNNPTYLDYDYTSSHSPTINTTQYSERNNINIKNITPSDFDGATGSFKKETYISRIGIYDKNSNLIGIAKLASPVRKTEIRNFTFKLKYDL